MHWNDIVQLFVIENIDDGAGGYTEYIRTRELFANRKSVRQSEHYQAAAVGLKPEAVFVLRTADYEGEQGLIYRGIRFDVLRTSEKGPDFIEVTVARTRGAGSE